MEIFVIAKCSCPECNVCKEVRWTHLTSRCSSNGKYYCNKRYPKYRDSMIYYNFTDEYLSKRADSLHEYLSSNPDAVAKRVDNLNSPEASHKSYLTRLENDTFMKSEWEKVINNEYNSVHAPKGYKNDEVVFKYELDCFFPSLNKGIEIDDDSHKEMASPYGDYKPLGYHYRKDNYFKGLGIEVLHLTTNRRAPRRPGYNNWREIVESFLEGTFNESLIMLSDEFYGDIVYEECLC